MKPYGFSFPIILHFDCSVNVALFVQTYDFIYKTSLLSAILSNNLILCNNFVKNSRLKFCETVCCQKLARQFRVNDSHNSYHKRGIQGNPSIEKITKLINIKPQFSFQILFNRLGCSSYCEGHVHFQIFIRISNYDSYHIFKFININK